MPRTEAFASAAFCATALLPRRIIVDDAKLRTASYLQVDHRRDE